VPVCRVWRSITFHSEANSPLCPYASLLNANEKVFRDHGFIHFTHNMRARSRRAFNNQTHSASGCLVATTGIIKRGLLQSETRSKFNRTVFLSLSMPVFIDRMKARFYSFGFPLTSFYCSLLSKPSASPPKLQTPQLDFQNLDGVLLCSCVDFFIPSSRVNFKRPKTPWCHQRSVALLSTGLYPMKLLWFGWEKKRQKIWDEINGPTESWSAVVQGQNELLLLLLCIYTNWHVDSRPRKRSPFHLQNAKHSAKKDLKWAQMKMKSECGAFEHGRYCGNSSKTLAFAGIHARVALSVLEHLGFLNCFFVS